MSSGENEHDGAICEKDSVKILFLRKGDQEEDYKVLTVMISLVPECRCCW